MKQAMHPERPWHATVVMFDAEGYTAHEWWFRYRPQTGGMWTCEWPGSMPLDELIDALAYLHTMSPRMRRITWDAQYVPIHRCAAPQWGLDAVFDDLPATPEGRLEAALFGGGLHWDATWFFPDEVGCIACRNWELTMEALYWLCECLWTRAALVDLREERERAG